LQLCQPDRIRQVYIGQLFNQDGDNSPRARMLQAVVRGCIDVWFIAMREPG